MSDPKQSAPEQAQDEKPRSYGEVEREVKTYADLAKAGINGVGLTSKVADWPTKGAGRG